MEPSSPHRLPAHGATMLDSLATAVLLVDDALTVHYMNRACEMLLRVSRNPALGQALSAVMPDSEALQAQIRRAWNEDGSFLEREILLSRHNGDPVLVDCSASPFAEGATAGILIEIHLNESHLRDDSQLARHQTSLQVVRGLAHEIKNPLGGLRGAAQLLQRELSRPELSEYTNVIIHEADRLQKLVDRLLGPNRPPQLQPVNLHQPLEHVRQLIEADLPAGISLERDYDPSLPDAKADADQLVQVFLNILRNAVQALDGRTDGRVVLRTRAQRRHAIAGKLHSLVACIEIEDNGPGIPDALREQIFFPLVSHGGNGSGLGLAIARTLVHAHEGQIECRSQPGQTVFCIYLPLKS